MQEHLSERLRSQAQLPTSAERYAAIKIAQRIRAGYALFV